MDLLSSIDGGLKCLQVMVKLSYGDLYMIKL